VHHMVFRSQLGDDVEENLITLCCNCHQKVHGRASGKDARQSFCSVWP
jgi:hypothetical protein